jgi:hypothetical protein
MQDSKSQSNTQVRLFWRLLFLGVLLFPVSLLEIIVPFFVDGLCGHVWGSLAAIGNIIGWLYFGLKSPMAPRTRMIWLVAFVFVVLVAIVEFAHLFHWHSLA